jgi:hypothetical protein
VNSAWAINELRDFISRSEQHRRSWISGAAGGDPALTQLKDDVIGRLPIVEAIAERAWPDWREHLPGRGSWRWEYEPLL